MALLRSALWYLSKWSMVPVFCNVFKKPMHDWGSLYASRPTPKDVVSIYDGIVRGGGRPAAVALLTTPESRVVVIDLDIYRVEFGMACADAAKLLADHGFVAAVTPRGGVRVVFRVPDGEAPPGRLSAYWYGEHVGEGSGTHKHLWHFPPSVACLKEDQGRCTEVGRYLFVLSGGRTARYPWDIGYSSPPTWRFEEAREVIETVLNIELRSSSQPAGQGEKGPLKTALGSGARPTIPCWRSLDEFREWLAGLHPPSIPLPACVARALGYEVTQDLSNAYTGEKVRKGLRFVLGAAAVMFLASTVAEAKPEEIVDFVGNNLEGYPADEGEPLNTKLSRLLTTLGPYMVPKYSGLGSIAASIPAELCERCPYSERCRRTSTGAERCSPWAAFTEVFWIHRVRNSP